MRSFGAQFKEYRESYLNITQTEAAAALNMKKESLSQYERDHRNFPPEDYKLAREIFQIPDDYFIAMVTGVPLKSVRAKEQSLPEVTKDLRVSYQDHFLEQFEDVILQNDEMRELIALVALLDKKYQRQLLNTFKGFTNLYQNEITKNERLKKELDECKRQSKA